MKNLFISADFNSVYKSIGLLGQKFGSTGVNFSSSSVEDAKNWLKANRPNIHGNATVFSDKSCNEFVESFTF